jgi:hypothetical protein
MGPFEGERGTVQSDGYILSDLGKLIHPANVSNGELVNKPKEVQAKSQTYSSESDLAKANDDLQLLQKALDRKTENLIRSY